jgi:hypothetical protein
MTASRFAVAAPSDTLSAALSDYGKRVGSRRNVSKEMAGKPATYFASIWEG